MDKSIARIFLILSIVVGGAVLIGLIGVWVLKGFIPVVPIGIIIVLAAATYGIVRFRYMNRS